MALDRDEVWQALSTKVERGEEAERILKEIFNEVFLFGEKKPTRNTLFKVENFFRERK